jgi:hypothetical protein
MGRLVEPIPGIKTKIKNYFELAEEIHEYFGYREDWVCIPMNNRMGDYWMIIGEGVDGRYVYSDEPFTKESVEAGKVYSGLIYTQRFLKKWVYRGKDMTLLCANTQTDGNKFLMIFENDKECKDEYLKKLYMDKWGKM